MRNDITRPSVHNWRKDTLVDVVMSLAFATRAIPGVQGHLEAACSVARASPSNGGGIEAAMQQLKGVKWQHAQSPSISGDPPSPPDTDVPSQQSSSGTTFGSGDCSAAVDDSAGNVLAADAPTPPKPICRSLWKGKSCEDPTSCDRIHKPLCTREACQSARNGDCQDWHYRPKKKRFSNGRPTTKPAGHPGNGKRGQSAPSSKSTKLEATRRMSQATEKMYVKWKLSEMQLKQSKMAAATYKDILMSNTSAVLPTNVSPVGLPSAKLCGSVHAQPHTAHIPVAGTLPHATMNLGPIVSQLEAIMEALKASGIMINHSNQN